MKAFAFSSLMGFNLLPMCHILFPRQSPSYFPWKGVALLLVHKSKQVCIHHPFRDRNTGSGVAHGMVDIDISSFIRFSSAVV